MRNKRTAFVVARELLAVARLMEGEMILSREMTADTEITMDQLIDADPGALEIIERLAKIGPQFQKVNRIVSGVYGNVISYDPGKEFNSDELKKLANVASSSKVQYVGFQRGIHVSIEWSGKFGN